MLSYRNDYQIANSPETQNAKSKMRKAESRRKKQHIPPHVNPPYCAQCKGKKRGEERERQTARAGINAQNGKSKSIKKENNKTLRRNTIRNTRTRHRTPIPSFNGGAPPLPRLCTDVGGGVIPPLSQWTCAVRKPAFS